MTAPSPHPRLYLDPDNLERNAASGLPLLREAADHVDRLAARFLEDPELHYPRGGHNEHLLRARAMQGRVVTMLVKWGLTGEETYRADVLRQIERMAGWSEWSWITWREGNRAPEAIFDLSYGENSATLALAFDWLADTLSLDEKRLFVDTANHWSFASAAHNIHPGASWWFGHDNSNWNTVCAGGMGMLALAMLDEISEAADILERVEESIAPYFDLLERTGGGWPEGLGYWNYGMRYGFMYLLSHERTTGRAHPRMKRRGVKRTLVFPLDLAPHGIACGFGDSNAWAPMPFHYALARRFDRPDVQGRLNSLVNVPREAGRHDAFWPNAAEWLVLHDGRPHAAAEDDTPVARLYKGLDWGLLADRPADPRLAVTVRGGTTAAPHTHLDLLSYHCVSEGVRTIENLAPSEYLDSTFSPRRFDLFEMRPESKNTILINGVGVTVDASCSKTERVTLPEGPGLRLVATDAYGRWTHGAVTRFCGRLFVLLDWPALLIVDRVELKHNGRMESRHHTRGEVSTTDASALVSRQGKHLRMAFGCDREGLLVTAQTAPTRPTETPATAIRWCAKELGREATLVTLLSPGRATAEVEVEDSGRRIVAHAKAGRRCGTVTLTRRLKPVKGVRS